MYKCPIEFIESAADSFDVSIEKTKNELVYQTVSKIGVEVDKEELLKALKYDRGQYEKGYRDGYQAGIEKFSMVINAAMIGKDECEVFEVMRKIFKIYEKLKGDLK